MSPEAVATFAQIIPVLFIAAFLSGGNIGSDTRSYIAASTYMILGAIAETACLVYLVIGGPMPILLASTVAAVAVLMLCALVATAIARLEEDREKKNRVDREDQ